MSEPLSVESGEAITNVEIAMLDLTGFFLAEGGNYRRAILDRRLHERWLEINDRVRGNRDVKESITITDERLMFVGFMKMLVEELEK